MQAYLGGAIVRRTAIVFLFILTAAPIAAAQTIHYVDDDAAPGGDGLLWPTAYDTLPPALTAAQPGDQIWVAAGTYVGNFTLAIGVEMYGGFAGTETLLDQRDWVANETILDGNQTGSVVTGTISATETTRIDGFTITRGSAGDYGGGLRLSSSSPTIANNTITGNTAVFNGGGLYLSGSSSTIVNNTIVNNGAGGFGGGIHVNVSVAATIANNTIMNNNASDGGGLSARSSSPTIVNNTITGNTATAYGGGLYLDDASATIANTIVAFNSSGVYRVVQTATPTLSHNCVYGNSAYNYGNLNPTGTNGNISVDPRLVDWPNGDVHLHPVSPCVGGGDNAFVWGAFDMDGQPRILPSGGTADIGADEAHELEWIPVIIRVSPDGNDANDGSSWALAKRTVNGGLEATLAYGGEVWVRAGTYHERITLYPYAHVYGGFTGTETERDERDWVAHVTILDGQQLGSVVTVLSGHGVSTIDGFTITGGSTVDGGGLYVVSSSPTVANNTITGNTAEGTGGGIYLTGSSTMATIANNIIAGNSATDGGGLFILFAPATIAYNEIRSNIAVAGGGLTLSNCSPTIANNAITANHADEDGGGLRLYWSSATIADNTVADNNAGGGGGGFWLSESSPTVMNTIVAFNSSGVYSEASAPALRHNCVFGNEDYEYSGLPDPTGTNGNIAADPEFADPKYGNMHIQPDSPCVDAGLNSDAWGEFDMDGEPRIHPVGGTVDIGADESDGTVWVSGPYAIVRVSPSGDDMNDGASWASAKRTMQAGIDAAAALGGEVWARAGTYEERVMLHPYAHVYGGFAGAETLRDERDWVANVTILDGRQEGSVIRALAGQGASTIDGFTITGGNALSGGGLYVWNSSPMVTNNSITGNNATYTGGGLFLRNSSATIANNKVTGNSAEIGGALRLVESSPTIANNTITGNSSMSGGGLYLYQSSPTIANTIVAFNSSGVVLNQSAPTLLHNCVYGNTAFDYTSGDPTGTDGNISVDPRLADPRHGDVHIQPGSPCVDAGDNANVSGGYDVDGDPRVLPLGGAVDIGADESDGTAWAAGPYPVVRVTTDGNDMNDGSSWALAKRSVQTGIDRASALRGEVWVRSGVYDELITLHPYAYVYGGFAGTETERTERDWVANATVLDGQQQGSVVTAQAGHGVGTIDGFTIRGGSAENGGGLYLYHASPAVANNTITDNYAVADGAGLYLYYSLQTITGNTITGNSAGGRGGGVYLDHSSSTIANDTISGNSASEGGGLYVDGPSPTIANTIVAFNSSGVYRRFGTVTHRSNCVYGNTAYDYSGLTDPTGTDGNVSTDPLFVREPDAGPDGLWATDDDDYGNLHLSLDSPVIDAGDNAEVPADELDFDGDGDTTEPMPFDLDGYDRFVDDPLTPDTGAGVAPIVDMGAYEFGPDDCRHGGGLDHDGDVDLVNFAAFERCVTGPGVQPSTGCECFDLDATGRVDLADVAVFQMSFTEQ